MGTNRERARELYLEFRREYYLAGFNQTAFNQRARRLAKKISPDNDWDAYMYMKYIETRLEIAFTFDG